MIPGVEHYRWLLTALILVFAIAALMPRWRGGRAIAGYARRGILLMAFGWVALIHLWDAWSGGVEHSVVHHLRKSEPGRPSITFIHGWQGAPASWGSFLDFILGDARFNGYGLLHVQFATRLTGANRSIEVIANDVDGLLAREVPGGAILLVGHSLGGVVARAILTGERSAIARRTTRLVTIGSPHAGAPPAQLLPELGLDNTILDDLAPGSSRLVRLGTSWEAFRRANKSSFQDFCIASRADAVVTPESATQSCGRHHILQRWGHTELSKPASRDDERYALPTSFLAD